MSHVIDADNDSDDDDGKGLFDDSDDDDDDDEKRPMSKKDRMEALRAKRRHDHGEPAPKEASKEGDEKGYDSGDSYDSSDFVRTKEDNDFIDMDDDDPDAINELYAEQKFDDERPLGSDGEESGRKKKKKGSSKPRHRGPDAISDDDEDAELNPIIAAVHKMKKKKRVAKKLSDLEEEAKDFLGRMEQAADEDDLAIRERRPATKKLAMLPEVLDMLARRDMMRLLLDFEILTICKRWVQPLPNGSLGNVTVRQQLLDAIGKMTGDSGVTAGDLKRSEFGKVVITLYMHKQEIPAMKRQQKKLIEQWSRPIFQKSGNMRDLEHVHASRSQAGGLAAMASARAQSGEARASRGMDERDVQDIITTGSRGTGSKEAGNRVRVPFSKGFMFTVRPQSKSGDVTDKRMSQGAPTKDTRGSLAKRMTDKGRAVAKNQRSANMSIEGRPAK